MLVGWTCNPSPRVGYPNGGIANADNHDTVPRCREAVILVRRPIVLLVPTFVFAFDSLALSLPDSAGGRFPQR